MKQLKVESFISGNAPLYSVVREYPELRMVPIEHYEVVKSGLHNLGYRVRIRYRGPHLQTRDTLKRNAHAFTVYFEEELI
jgi:hypothetical protein